MKKNNFGFSLVELIVAFAIAAIAGLAGFQMMSYGNNIFKKTSNDIGLQYEQQLVVNQLRDYILESTNAISLDEDNNALYTFKQTGKKVTESGVTSVPYVVSKITFDDPKKNPSDPDVTENSTGFLYLNTSSGLNSLDEDYKAAVADKGDKFGSDIKNLTYDLSQVKKGKVAFDITFLSEGREYTSHQVISLRNNVIVEDTLTDIFDTTLMEISSFVYGISVYRDGIKIGDTDTIKGPGSGLADGERWVAHYTAVVNKNEYSDATEDVEWTYTASTGITPIEDGKGGIDVYVEKGVVNGTVTLSVKSVAEPTIKKDIVINVLGDGGRYPKEAVLSIKTENVACSDGRIEFSLQPEISYTNMADGTTDTVRGEEALKLIDWHVNDADKDALWAATMGTVDNIDSEGKIYFSKVAEGCSFRFYFTVKQKKADGTTLVSNEVTINVGDCSVPVIDTPFKIVVDKYIMRDSFIEPVVAWQAHSIDDNYFDVDKTKDSKYYENEDCYYIWKVVPSKKEKDSSEWNSKELPFVTRFEDIVKTFEYTQTSSFNSNVKFNSKVFTGIDGLRLNPVAADGTSYGSDGWYVCDSGNAGLLTYIESFLQWNSQFEVKFLCYAVSKDKQVLYDSAGRTVDLLLKSQSGSVVVHPVEQVAILPKVVVYLTPSNKVTGLNRSDLSVSDYIRQMENQYDQNSTDQRYYKYSAFGLNLADSNNAVSVSGVTPGKGIIDNNKKRDVTADFKIYTIANQPVNLANVNHKPVLDKDNNHIGGKTVIGWQFPYVINDKLTDFSGSLPRTLKIKFELKEPYYYEGNLHYDNIAPVVKSDKVITVRESDGTDRVVNYGDEPDVWEYVFTESYK